jgi:hypothetical protein
MIFLPVSLLLLLLPLSVAAKKQVRVDHKPTRRNIRHLPDPMFDALGKANDPRLEEYLDWQKDGGFLKDILIPRARESAMFGTSVVWASVRMVSSTDELGGSHPIDSGHGQQVSHTPLRLPYI